MEVTQMNERLPSVINDPFKKTKITNILVSAYEGYGSKWVFYGNVVFKNGSTTGEQRFEGNSFDDVVLKVKAMLDTLE